MPLPMPPRTPPLLPLPAPKPCRPASWSPSSPMSPGCRRFFFIPSMRFMVDYRIILCVCAQPDSRQDLSSKEVTRPSSPCALVSFDRSRYASREMVIAMQCNASTICPTFSKNDQKHAIITAMPRHELCCFSQSPFEIHQARYKSSPCVPPALRLAATAAVGLPAKAKIYVAAPLARIAFGTPLLFWPSLHGGRLVRFRVLNQKNAYSSTNDLIFHQSLDSRAAMRSHHAPTRVVKIRTQVKTSNN